MNLDALKVAFPDAVLDVREFRGEWTLSVHREEWLSLARHLKEDPGCDYGYLIDVCGSDRSPAVPRFAVVYHLCSLARGMRLRVEVAVPEDAPVVPSVVSLWPTAEWHERECFDLFGIRFSSHPDLRRLLLPDDFPDHPLRKDYPLEGRSNP